MAKERRYYVYIVCSRRNGTLYIGVTSNLIRRIWEHKEKAIEGFTELYSVDRLVWFEVHNDVKAAIAREKQVKKWSRAWKLRLIEKSNPDWKDLYEAIV